VFSQTLKYFHSLSAGLICLGLLLHPQATYAQQGGCVADSFRTFLIEPNLKPFLGFGTAVIESGETDFSYTYGYQSNDLIDAFTDSTIFNLGSASKLFTALAVVKLADQGAISLDDPVYYYFPEFLDIQGKGKFAPQVTIMDLLQHRSGITQSMEDLFPEKFEKDVLESEDQYYENTFNYRAFLNCEDFRNRFLLYARLDDKPQKAYHFSNLGFVILGYIVEQVAEMNLGQFVTNNIFVPLKMNDSHYYLTPDSLTSRLALGYYKLSDGSYLNVHINEAESPSPTGDGGIKTSLRDMVKFMHFMNGDRKNPAYEEVMPRTSLLSMMAPQKKAADKKTWVGIGFHNLQPWNFTGHAGGWDGFLSILYYHPESDSCLFLVTNREDNELFQFLRIYAAYAMLYRKL
jgi:CubicO group peptidase (beta-lactamase class C family)